MLRNYLKIAFRNLKKHKGYAMINVAGLAIGLAAFWLIALYVADELSYDRYNENADRLVRVVQYANWEGNSLKLAPTSAPFAPALKAAFPEIEDAARIDIEGGGIIEAGEKKIKAGDIIFADKSLLRMFSYQFLYGNTDALDKPNAIVIAESLANRLFGGADKAINQVIEFDTHNAAVITAVIKDIPANSHLRFSAVRALPADFTEGWQQFHLYTYLLLKKGTDYAALQQKLPAFAARTIQKEMGIKDYRMELQPVSSIHLHSNLDFEISPNGSMGRVYVFIGIAALILVIAMINYMNLTTARSTSRIREIGIRKTIGSGRWHLAGMFISESVLVTLISGLLAAVIVQSAIPLFNRLTGKELSLWQFGMKNTVLMLLAFSIVVGIISGIYPAVFLSRFKTIPALKGELGNQSANIVFRKSLVVFQFVITVVMISGSLVIYRQLQFALHKDLGFNKEQVLTFHIDNRDVRQQIPALKTQLLQSPLIAGVAAAGNPIGNNDLGGHAYRFENNDGSIAQNTKITQELMVDADYLGTMEIKLLNGRNFSDQTPTDQYGAALVNETLVKEMGWKDPVGKRMEFNVGSNIFQRTVIGVIKDFHTYSLQHKVEPLVLVMPPAAPDKDNLYVKIAKGKTAEGLAWIDKVYRRFDKTSPVEYHFLDKNFAQQYASEQRQGQVALIFTILAVLIACLGLFGLAAFTAAQRTKEIGIRKVLGASVTGIVVLLSKDFVKLICIAALIAFPLAWWGMNKWLDNFAYRIDLGWWIFAAAGLVSLLIALLTVSYQAVKAAMANPVKSLRTE